MIYLIICYRGYCCIELALSLFSSWQSDYERHCYNINIVTSLFYQLSINLWFLGVCYWLYYSFFRVVFDETFSFSFVSPHWVILMTSLTIDMIIYFEYVSIIKLMSFRTDETDTHASRTVTTSRTPHTTHHTTHHTPHTTHTPNIE